LAIAFDQVVPCLRFDMERGARYPDVDFPRKEAELVTNWFGNHQASCLVNGCSHAYRMPYGGSGRRSGPTSEADQATLVI
jgi:hypothetical protein